MIANDKDFLISRTFKAPRELVFRAWTEPKLIAQWWGPRNFINSVTDMDVRPGGKYRLVMRSPEDVDFPITGEYREIEKPKRLVQTMDCTEHPSEWHDMIKPGEANPAGLMVMTALFDDLNGSTKLVINIRFEAAEIRDAMVKMGMHDGWSQSLDRLAELLEKEY